MRVSAIWTRDSKRWLLETNITKSAMPTIDKNAAKDGLLIDDICDLPTPDEIPDPTCIVLYSEAKREKEQRRILINATEQEIIETNTQLTEKGIPSQRTISVRTTSNGDRLYTGIWSSEGAPSELRPAYSGFELVHQPQWDIAVAPAGRLPDPRFAALWHADIHFESKLITVDATKESRQSVQQLIAQGYRPHAIAADSTSNCKLLNSNFKLLLHLPVIADEEKESLAIAQSSAATALLRLGAADRVWPLLQDQPDPRMRSYLLHRLATYRVDPQSLINQLTTETEVSRQRSLILGPPKARPPTRLGMQAWCRT